MITWEAIKKILRVFDFDNPENNHFLVVRQLEVTGELYSRRPDLVAFVNGIPFVFTELKAHPSTYEMPMMTT